MQIDILRVNDNAKVHIGDCMRSYTTNIQARTVLVLDSSQNGNISESLKRKLEDGGDCGVFESLAKKHRRHVRQIQDTAGACRTGKRKADMLNRTWQPFKRRRLLTDSHATVSDGEASAEDSDFHSSASRSKSSISHLSLEDAMRLIQPKFEVRRRPLIKQPKTLVGAYHRIRSALKHPLLMTIILDASARHSCEADYLASNNAGSDITFPYVSPLAAIASQALTFLAVLGFGNQFCSSHDRSRFFAAVQQDGTQTGLAYLFAKSITDYFSIHHRIPRLRSEQSLTWNPDRWDWEIRARVQTMDQCTALEEAVKTIKTIARGNGSPTTTYHDFGHFPHDIAGSHFQTQLWHKSHQNTIQPVLVLFRSVWTSNASSAISTCMSWSSNSQTRLNGWRIFTAILCNQWPTANVFTERSKIS